MGLQQRQFRCNHCENTTDAPKSRGRTNPGHIKSMYCYICQMITNHIQIDEFERRLEDGPRVNELIKINYDNDRPTISARDLYEFLEVSTEYRHWFPRMCEYGFSEGVDFNPFKNDRVQREGDRLVTRTVDDAQLTVDMAKEISMLQRNERGKQARQYFIQLEAAWNSPEQVMARALKLADRRIHQLEQTVHEQQPMVLFAKAVKTSDTSILVGDLAKLIKQNGVDIGQNRLFQQLRDNGYLCSQGERYNMPTQRGMELGLFEVRERTINNPDGSVRITRTTKVTGKGQIYFINRYCGRNVS